uniref:hypothetical protein n=1 Tax=Aeribacillus sp. FSL k6-2211 TaxID=2954608 RepID=UPI00403FB18B
MSRILLIAGIVLLPFKSVNKFKNPAVVFDFHEKALNNCFCFFRQRDFMVADIDNKILVD